MLAPRQLKCNECLMALSMFLSPFLDKRNYFKTDSQRSYNVYSTKIKSCIKATVFRTTEKYFFLAISICKYRSEELQDSRTRGGLRWQMRDTVR